MTNSVTVIKVDGTRINLDHRPTLEQAQEIVGGYIELVKAKDEVSGEAAILVVNEDGRPLKLPTNWAATNNYWTSLGHVPLVGNIIVLIGWKTVGN